MSANIGIILAMVFTAAPLMQGDCNLQIERIKSTRLTGPGDVFPDSDVHLRKKRDMTDQERTVLLDLHNKLRRQEGSSDMELMSWSSDLEKLASGWARRCLWEHGQPDQSSSYAYVGQNLYASSGSFSAPGGVQAWYDEKKFYDFDNKKCSTPPCGHYTQIVWATSKALGCSYNYCPRLSNSRLNEATYLVCNYGPGGNIGNQQSYKKGKACSQCSSGQGWCKNNLCTEDCVSESEECSCEARCQNCGTVVKSTCSCSCTSGWTGNDCSEKCVDRHLNCGANPGWPAYWCDRTYVVVNCPVLCNICNSTVSDAPCVSNAITISGSTFDVLVLQATLTLFSILIIWKSSSSV